MYGATTHIAPEHFLHM